MTTQYKLKPFVLNGSDLSYILNQVTFRPLFDAQGNAIIAWDGVGAIYDTQGNLIANGGAAAGDPAALAALDLYGPSYASVIAAQGVRDVTGLNNNLLQVHSSWGAVDQPFPRLSLANYLNYSTSLTSTDPNAYFAAKDFAASLPPMATDYAPAVSGSGASATVTLQNVVDYTPRMISQTISTGGVALLTEADLGVTGPNSHHIVFNTPLLSDGVTVNSSYDANGVQGIAIVKDYGLLSAGQLGQIDYQNPTSGENFIGATNPGVAPANGWFALFGQFFDHGLDFIDKSSGKTIKIALAQDDPLYGVKGPDGQPVTSITITRATPAGIDANGDVAYINHTSPYIDQSQTYGSSDQITNLLREWVSADGGATFHAGMNLFDGDSLSDSWTRPDGTITNDTLPTLNELRNEVVATQRDALTWEDVLNYRNRDDAGHVSAGNSGQSLILDMNPRFDEAHMQPATDAVDTDGNGTSDVDEAITLLNLNVRPGDSFGMVNGVLTLTLGTPLVAGPTTLDPGDYSGASALMMWVNFADFSITAPAGPVHDAVGAILLASVGDHYIAGDGRVNENFGLTAIHHVFHEEHNYQIQNLQNAIYAEDAASGGANHEILHGWQADTGLQDQDGNFVTATGEIAWDADKMFQAAKLIVEMEYQHAAVDQYARTITPRIPEFVGYSSGQDSTVTLEYAQAAFRFGHSTIRETIDTIDPTQGLTGKIMSFALESAFLNPQGFAENGPGAIALGMSHQQMNEVDEFITPALSQGLLGQPLDLAAINIARGRDIGIPTLNDFREAVGLVKYTSWADFGQHMIHPGSLVNFIAAYAFDGDTAKAAAIIGLDNGSIAEGSAQAMDFTLNDAIAFLNNDTSHPVIGAGSFNSIDTWIGGLAEAHVPGGLLGETFDLVFVSQINALMDGDRFYYLYRLVNQQFGEEVNNGQFKDIVERNTGLSHLNGSIFAYADKYYEFSNDAAVAADAGVEHKYGQVIAANAALNGGEGVGIYSDGGFGAASNGSIITLGGKNYVRDIRPELNADTNLDGTPVSGANSHEVIVATDQADYIHAREGDDTVYGEGGNDSLFGDGGVDRLYGGDGDDIIDTGEGPDLADGGAGDDIIYGRGSGSEVGGFDQLIGGSGNDVIYGGEGIDKLSGGAGDDQIFGGDNTDPFTHGGDGNDYIDGGTSGDNLYGDDGDDFVYGNNDQDIVSGGDGDDMLRPGLPSSALGGGPDEVLGGDGFTDTGYGGKTGFDLIDFSDYQRATNGITLDFATQANPLVAIDGTTPMPAWTQVEAAAGTQNDDIIIGDDIAIDLIDGVSLTGNWLFGGSGNDTITGNGGNDVIAGDSIRLDTLIGSYSGGYVNVIDGATHRATGPLGDGLLGNAALGTAMFDKHFEELLKTELFKDLTLGADGGTAGTDDTVVFVGQQADYTIEQVTFIDGFNNEFVAFKITDNGHVSQGANDPARAPSDGTDLVMGVEHLRFADGTLDIPTIAVNYAPVIVTRGGNPFAQPIDENAVAGTIIADIDGTDANNVVTDPLNPQTLTYSFMAGSNAQGLFAIDGATGVITLTGVPDYEALAVLNATAQVLNVQLSDGIASDTQQITVNIRNVNEAGSGAVNLSTTNYQRNANTVTLNATSTVSDADVIGAASVHHHWQQLVGNTWTDVGGPGAAYTASAGAAVQQLRVAATYTDATFGQHAMTPSPETAFIGTVGGNIITGTSGTDLILGFGGNDTFVAAGLPDGDDRFDGGSGTDTYDISLTSSAANINLSGADVTVNNTVLIAGQATSAEIGTDTLISINNIIGSSADNIIVSNTAANIIRGGGGNDTIVVVADNLRDTFSGQSGNDTIDYSGYTNGLTVTLNGTNTVIVSGSGSNPAGPADNRDRISSISNFTGGSGDDAITGDNSINILKGGAGNDRINGDGGDDVLNGGAGNDRLTVSTGNDTIVLEAGFGNDRAIGFDAIGGPGVQDLIDLTGLGITVANFAASVTITDIGNDTLITIGTDGTLRLVGVDGNGNNVITQADFLVS